VALSPQAGEAGADALAGAMIVPGASANPRQVPAVVMTPAAPETPRAVAANTSALRQTRAQGLGVRAQDGDSESYAIQLEVPTLERVTRRESEKDLQERMRQEARNRPNIDRVEFPDEPVLSTETYSARQYPPMTCVVEPNYVCYGRLYFEERNSERFGWDLGVIQPLVSAGIFYWDVITLPYHLGTDPCRCHECSAGYCLPGDPIPYYLYPPQISITGAILEGGAVVGLVGLFPT
jgi:hypothetical protein